jgi:hypothetical protein
VRSYRNPFRTRTLEQQTQSGIDEFLKIFSPGVLDLLPETIWDRPLLIWSAPGFGKTSLMNAFDAAVIRTVAKRRPRHAKIAEYLEGHGALRDGEPLIVGLRVPLSRDFKSLLDLGAPDMVSLRLFNRLLDARVGTAYVRALLAFEGRAFPDDADVVELVPTAETEDALDRLGGPSGAGILAAAEATTREIRDLLDALVPPPYDHMTGHSRLYSLDVLGGTRAIVRGTTIEARPLVMFDDGHDLAASQREHLLAMLRDRQLNHARWYAERYTALNPIDVVSDDEAARRTIEVVRLEQATRDGSPDIGAGGRRTRQFENLLLDVADRRAVDPLRLYDNESRTFTQLVDTEEARFPPPSNTQATEVAKKRVEAVAGTNERYREWLTLAEQRASEEGALPWRELEILLERDKSRTQGELFEQVLTEEDWQARSGSAIREAARLFLANELNFPYYFGARTIARLGSSNIDQFVQLGGDLFEEMLTLITLNRSPELDPTRQHRLIIAASERLWKAIPVHLDRGRDIQRLLFAIARMAHRETYRPTAPYPPGPNATAITMTDRDRLRVPQRRERLAGGDAFLPVLAGAIANNLLYAEIDRSVKGGRWMVLYLNRLLLPRFKLPLGHGNFRERQIEVLISWAAGEDDLSPEQAVQLPLPVSLEELQL